MASLKTPTSTSAAAPGGPGSSDEFKQAVQRYQQCMRDNGFAGSGGTVDSDGTGQGPVVVEPGTKPSDRERDRQFAEAQQKCRQFLPNGGAMPTPDPDLLDKQRKWIRCLQDKGLDVAESTDGSAPQVGIPDNDLEARKKVEECDKQVFGALPQSETTVGGTR